MTDGAVSRALPEPDQVREVLRRLEIDIQRRLDGLLHGEYRGLVPGQGSEPGETREYQPGDDVRRIDWNVSARLPHVHVRETIADRELETRVLVDFTPSLDFGTARYEKRDLAIAAVAAVGFLTARVGNRFGAEILHQGDIVTVPSKQGRLHLLAILHRLHELPKGDGEPTDLAKGIARLDTGSRRAGLSVVVSDFLDRADWPSALKRLAVRHDVLAVEILDPRELELPNVGVLTVVDPRTGRQRDIQTAKARVRERYAAAAAEQREQTAEAIRSAGADHLILRTDRDWILDLAKFVSVRRKRNESVPGLSR